MTTYLIEKAVLLLHTLVEPKSHEGYRGYIHVLEHASHTYAVVFGGSVITWIPTSTSWRGAIEAGAAKALVGRDRGTASMHCIQKKPGDLTVYLTDDLNNETVADRGHRAPDYLFGRVLDLARPALDQDTTIPPTGMDIDLDHLARVRTYLRKASRAPTVVRAQVLLRFGGPLDPVIIASKDPDFRCTTLMMPVHPRRELRPGQWVWS